MLARSAFLLSPYRLPTHHSVSLDEAEMAAWLNGYLLSWHPALLRDSSQLPKVDSAWDHETPAPGNVYVTPESPTLYLPDNWDDRVREVGAVRLEANSDFAETFAGLPAALAGGRESPVEDLRAFCHHPDTQYLAGLSPDEVRPFLGLGLGYLVVESLFDAMDHEHLLMLEEFRGDIAQAVTAALSPDTRDAMREHLKSAAGRLLSAREALYYASIQLVDVVVLHEGKIPAAWPSALARGNPLNVVASAEVLRQLRESSPERFAELHEALNRVQEDGQPGPVELAGGIVRDREDAVLPLESQLWNLQRGRSQVREMMGDAVDVSVLGRTVTAWHPGTPALVYACGMRQILLWNQEFATLPKYRAAVIQWSSPDGRSAEALTRVPQPAHLAGTFFNLVTSLHQTIRDDSTPTFVMSHSHEADSPLAEVWYALADLAPVLGQWTGFKKFFSETMAGEYTGAIAADEFFNDYLDMRVLAQSPVPVSAFAQHARTRRRLDAAFTYASIQQTLSLASVDDLERLADLRRTEDEVETAGLTATAEQAAKAAEVETYWATRLVTRLQGRAAESTPGWMVLNPCSFTRRVAVEIPGFRGPVAADGPIKAAQFDDDAARLVVEIPPLGYAWIPETPGAASRPRVKSAEGTVIRNEFLEAEIDPRTGGLLALRDGRTRVNRVSQALIYNPSTTRMEARSVRIVHAGAALGEIQTEGELFDEQNELIATFRQRFRLWMSRPILEVRIDLDPIHPPAGYGWHGYYGCRFAVRDDRAAMFRGVAGAASLSSHTRPMSPEFIEFRSLGRSNVCIFPNGLPFHQRSGTRFLDTLLVPEGETGRSFDIALGIDRELPAQTAQGLLTPVPVLKTGKGPPSSGPSAWLFQVDAPNLLLNNLRPEVSEAGKAAAILARLTETTGFGGSANLNCVRTPTRAVQIDGNGTPTSDLSIGENSVTLDFSANDLLNLRLEMD